jgi:hypothetical protein
MGPGTDWAYHRGKSHIWRCLSLPGRQRRKPRRVMSIRRHWIVNSYHITDQKQFKATEVRYLERYFFRKLVCDTLPDLDIKSISISKSLRLPMDYSITIVGVISIRYDAACKPESLRWRDKCGVKVANEVLTWVKTTTTNGIVLRMHQKSQFLSTSKNSYSF